MYNVSVGGTMESYIDIMTWNIDWFRNQKRTGKKEDYDERDCNLEVIKKISEKINLFLGKKKNAIVFLQEIPAEEFGWKSINYYAEFLKYINEYGYVMKFNKNIEQKALRYTVAVYHKDAPFSVIKEKIFDDRMICVKYGSIKLIGVHMPTVFYDIGCYADKMWTNLIEYVQQCNENNQKLIVAGDFNAFVGCKSDLIERRFNELTRLMKDIVPVGASTFVGNTTIDHIFYNFATEQRYKVTIEREFNYSDHKYVQVTRRKQMYIEKYILDVLVKHSSKEHPMKQKEIIDETIKLLKSDPHYVYDKDMSSTIKRRLKEMVEHRIQVGNTKDDTEVSDYDFFGRQPGIYCYEKSNSQDEKEDGTIVGYWIENNLSDDELRYILDSVLYSKILPHDKVESMIKRIITTSNKDFGDSVKYYKRMKKQVHISKIDTMENVGIIQEAIKQRKKIEFNLNVYKWQYNHSTRKNELVLVKCREDKYVCSPYDIVYNNGRYFLLAANSYQENHGGYYYVRVDLMTDIVITSEKAVSKEDVKMRDTDDLFKYRIQNQHIYSGDVGKVRLKVKTDMLQRIVDSFANEFDVERVKLDENSDAEDYIVIKLEVNKESFKFWVLQHSQYVEVVEPLEYRNEIKKLINEIAKKYN